MEAIFILGSNLGDKHQIIAQAKELMSEKIGILKKESSEYETEPWGFTSDNLFLNKVLIFETELNPDELIYSCLDIEKELGRIRPKNITANKQEREYTSRSIDIDILFYGDRIINTEHLVVPHPKLQYRNFVLNPLNEICPDFIHPILHKNISTLLKECEDTLKCTKE